MSWLGDILGGKKAPPPPAEIRKAAERMYGIAGDFAPRVGHFRDFVNTFDFKNRLNRASATSAEGYGAASATARDIGDEYWDLWQDPGKRILHQAGMDALNAGDQEGAARDARDAAVLGIEAQKAARADNLMRRGRFGGGADSAHLAVLEGAATGKAANDARLQERMYGEQFRRGAVPMAAGFGDALMRNRMMVPHIDREGVQVQFEYPRMMADLYRTEGGLASHAQGLYGGAQSAFGNSYNADMTKLNADNQRRQAIFGNAFKLLNMPVDNLSKLIPGAPGPGGGGPTPPRDYGSTLQMKLGTSGMGYYPGM